MLITDPFFLFYFFPIFISFYYTTIKYVKISNIVILIASIYFYATFGVFQLPILLLPLVGDYLLGIYIYKTKNKPARKFALLLGIVVNIGILFYFKYVQFAVTSINEVTGLDLTFQQAENLIIPLGISFITFQRISYIVDIYRKVIAPSTSFLSYATYACLFPHLISGPIVRFSELKTQLTKRLVDLEAICQAIKLLIIGFSFKILIANQILPLEDLITKQNTINSLEAIILMLAFSFRIYFDFLGYTLMALGLAKFMGFDFPQNFNSPYQAKSITQFWRRWNMTLSRWIRDYLYIPLGGNRKGGLRTCLNLIIVMLIAGIWHGASWNFVIWGGIHGCFLVLERILKNVGGSINTPNAIKIFYSFTIVNIAWMFFKFTDIHQALYVLRSVVSLDFSIPTSPIIQMLLAKSVVVVFAIIFSFWLSEEKIEELQVNVITLFLLALLLITSVFFAISTSGPSFIYYQF